MRKGGKYILPVLVANFVFVSELPQFEAAGKKSKAQQQILGVMFIVVVSK